jgi:hypothetical protein
MRLTLAAAVAATTLVASMNCWAQLQGDPEGSHVDLYFPHLADGGDNAYKFQTSLIFLNPSRTSTASAMLNLLSDSGGALRIDFGNGPASTFRLKIPPGGTITLRSTAASQSIVSGWADCFSTLPLQATVQFRSIVNGVPQQTVSALSTSPAQSYVSPATVLTGLALANTYTNLALLLNVSAIDATGMIVGTAAVSVPALGHRAFNLNSLIPSLSPNFVGSVRVTPSAPSTYFLGWTLGVDASGVLSSYPPGGQAWPVNHVDRIRDVYYKDLDAAQTLATAVTGVSVQFDESSVPLHILEDHILNAYALKSDNSVNIEIALSELISDSPSELAFAVAHEMGHTIQFRTGKQYFASNVESDADQWGMFISMVAGYDPYAAAGTLAKLSMASNDSSLLSQAFDNISSDVHGSFNNRIALVYSSIQTLCASSAGAQFCALYKANFHPHFPKSTPLARPTQTHVPEAPIAR